MADGNPLDQIKGRTFTMYEENGKGRLLWDVFKGNMSFTLMEERSKKDNKLVYDEVRILLVDGLKRVLDGKTDKVTMVSSRRKDRESRERVQDYVMTLGLDESRKIYLDLNFGSGARRFSLGRVVNVETGSEKMSDVDQSILRAKVFLDWLVNFAAMEMVLTSRRSERQGGGGGNKGGGSWSGGGSKGGEDYFSS